MPPIKEEKRTTNDLKIINRLDERIADLQKSKAIIDAKLEELIKVRDGENLPF